ncbi:hypothetical protein [Fluviicola taffensis]|uniref:hypothetical protein n=1 Tax=Fluviicola taffensis TaxID=191579 RepID=UPI003137FCC8
MKRKIEFCLLLLLMASCHKVEDRALNKKSDVPQSDLTTEQFLDRAFKQKMSQAAIDYMSSRPQADPEEVKKHLNGETNGHNKAAAVWGITSNRQVWKWNGSSWFMPNSAAGLDWIDVSTQGGGVWGISNTHIYKWNGTSWSEPNPAAGLYSISAISGSTAIGIGGSGIPFITLDGGLSWYYLGTMSSLNRLNAGDPNNTFAWGIQQYSPSSGSVSQRLVKYDLVTNTWTTVSTPTVPKWVDQTFSTDVCWYITNVTGSGSIYKGGGSISFFQPNSAAGLAMVSSYDYFDAWGISSNRVFHTTDGGASWAEPNPAARLAFISAGYE